VAACFAFLCPPSRQSGDFLIQLGDFTLNFITAGDAVGIGFALEGSRSISSEVFSRSR